MRRPTCAVLLRWLVAANSAGEVYSIVVGEARERDVRVLRRFPPAPTVSKVCQLYFIAFLAVIIGLLVHILPDARWLKRWLERRFR